MGLQLYSKSLSALCYALNYIKLMQSKKTHSYESFRNSNMNLEIEGELPFNF